MRKTVAVGQVWSHYKHPNLYYKIIAIGTNTESLEEMVVYQALFESEKWGPNKIWIRPLKMWFDKININGKEVSRFTLIQDVENNEPTSS